MFKEENYEEFLPKFYTADDVIGTITDGYFRPEGRVQFFELLEDVPKSQRLLYSFVFETIAMMSSPGADYTADFETGWFYMPECEVADFIGCSTEKVAEVRKYLVKIGVMSSKRIYEPGSNWLEFKINWDNLYKMLDDNFHKSWKNYK